VGNRKHSRTRKFYASQVEKILSLLDKHFLEGQIDIDKYLRICEQLGEEPDPDKMPIDRADYPSEVQDAFFMHDFLSDKWDGMSGSYLGKDYSNLETLLNIYEIENRKQVVLFLKHIEARYMTKINKEVEAKRKASSKGKKPSIPKARPRRR
tara:strand:+ start:232 stop:687 length:456 start_codon:yes stop_codon:yes gene_type:complete